MSYGQATRETFFQLVYPNKPLLTLYSLFKIQKNLALKKRSERLAAFFYFPLRNALNLSFYFDKKAR